MPSLLKRLVSDAVKLCRIKSVFPVNEKQVVKQSRVFLKLPKVNMFHLRKILESFIILSFILMLL